MGVYWVAEEYWMAQLLRPTPLWFWEESFQSLTVLSK
jgi:hypothetical protein